MNCMKTVVCVGKLKEENNLKEEKKISYMHALLLCNKSGRDRQLSYNRRNTFTTTQ